MTTFSGSFAGKAKLQATVALSDSPNHELSLVEVTGPQKSTDVQWNNAKITYWGIADLVAGSGPQHGYFVTDHADGDRDWGTFEGKITVSGEQVTLEGTWQFTGGTEKFKGLSGRGSYQGRMASPSEVNMEWTGEYQLAQAQTKAAAD